VSTCITFGKSPTSLTVQMVNLHGLLEKQVYMAAGLDMLVDLAAQILLVAAVAQIIVVRSDAEPILVGAFASAWLVNLFISVMASGQGAQSIIDSRSPLVQVAKATRDYGVMTLALGLLVILWTSGVIFFAYFYLVLNMIVLILSIYKTARLGYRN